MDSLFEIKHHGAVNGVTGSCHELVLNDGSSILIDCGLFQGAETSPSGSDFEQLTIDFPVEKIKALVVTHVHIDHVGRIPYLVAAGFNGPIVCSEPSAQLLPLVLEDALKIGFTRDKQLVEAFLHKVGKMIVPLPYKQWFSVDTNNGVLKVKLKQQPFRTEDGRHQISCHKTGQDQWQCSQHTPCAPSRKIRADRQPC